MFQIEKTGRKYRVSGASIYLAKSREMLPLVAICKTYAEAETKAAKFAAVIIEQAEDELARREAIAAYLAKRATRAVRVAAQFELFA